jgi:hypothetical protein
MMKFKNKLKYINQITKIPVNLIREIAKIKMIKIANQKNRDPVFVIEKLKSFFCLINLS